MKTLIAHAAILLMITSCSPTRMINGTWTGVGDQIDGNQWDVVLTAKNANVVIEYPSLECGGEWRLAQKPAEDIEFKELILFGVERCDQGVEVHVKKVSKNQLKVVYYLREHDPNQPIATAVLTKVE